MTDGRLAGLLVALEARLAARGAPVVASLRPGASPERVTAVVGDVPDLVTWWGWHDGAEGRDVPAGPGLYEGPENRLVGGWHVLSLDDAARIERWQRDDLATIGMPELVPAPWFPVLHYGGAGASLWLDRAAGGLFVVDGQAGLPDDPPVPQFGSLSELVERWLQQLDGALPPEVVARHPYW